MIGQRPTPNGNAEREKIMAQEKRNARSGNVTWREFMNVVAAGRGGEYGRVPRGGLAVGGRPTEELPWVSAARDADVEHAPHVVLHYRTTERRKTWRRTNT